LRKAVADAKQRPGKPWAAGNAASREHPRSALPSWDLISASLGPVKTKRQVAVPGVLLPGEAHKRGNTLAVLTLLGNKAWRQKNGTLKARVADAQGQHCSFGLVVL
jgi:hypothetical protein